MAQYDVHRNKGATAARYPYLLVLQSGLLHRWNRRVVVPLAPDADDEPAPERCPAFEVVGRTCRMLTYHIVNVPRSGLGEVVANLDADSDRIVAALDLVFSRGFPVA